MLRCPYGRTVVSDSELPARVGRCQLRGERRATIASSTQRSSRRSPSRATRECSTCAAARASSPERSPTSSLADTSWGSTHSPPCSTRRARVPARTSHSCSGPCSISTPSCPDSGTFDLVMSRSALHWVPEEDHPPLLAECFRLLRPGGRLRIECGGGDNVRAMMALFGDCSAKRGGPQCPWTYFGAGAYLELVEAAGFSVEDGWVRTVAQHRRFDRDGSIGWLDLAVLPGLRSASARVGARGLSGRGALSHRRAAASRRQLRRDLRAPRRARLPTPDTETDVTAIGRSTHPVRTRNDPVARGVLTPR